VGVDGKHGPTGYVAVTGRKNLEAAIMREEFDEEVGIAGLPEEMTLEELEELNRERPELNLPMKNTGNSKGFRTGSIIMDSVSRHFQAEVREKS
jgi:hypothetical protein